MKPYMLNVGHGLAVSAAERAAALARRRETLAAGKLNSLADVPPAIENLPARMAEGDRLTCRYGTVAVMHISGAIASSEEDPVCWLMGGVPSAWIEADARDLAEDPTVETVVLALATPGGAVSGFATVSQALKDLGSKKRLIAVVSDAAYSLGAIVAAHASECYISPTGGMGNVGVVFGPFVDETRALDKAGVEVWYAVSPDGKAWGRPGAALPQDFRDNLTRAMRVWYLELTAVFANRGITTADLDAMNGAIYAGADAVAMGLADGVQTLAGVVGALISGKDIEPIAQPEEGPGDDTEEPEPITIPQGTLPRATLETHMQMTEAHWGALTADAIKSKRPDLVANLAPKVEPIPAASIDELEAAFPGEAEFVLAQAKAKATLADANAKFVGILRDRLTAANASAAEWKTKAEAKTETPAAAKAAAAVAQVQVVEAGSIPGAPSAQSCPFKTSAEAISAIAKEKRITIAAAANEARKQYPALFAA